jgi:hypothetical protein
VGGLSGRIAGRGTGAALRQAGVNRMPVKTRHASAATEDPPPIGSVALKELIFCHPSVTEAAAASLRLTWAGVVVDGTKIVWRDSRRSFEGQTYTSEGSFSGSLALWHTFYTRGDGETDNHYSQVKDAWAWDNPAPVHAAWYTAYSKVLDLLRAGKLRLWGRPGGVLKPGVFLPADCLPTEANRPHFDSNAMELADGTSVFSCHLVPAAANATTPNEQSKTGTIKAEKHMEAWFGDRVAKSPDCRTLTKSQLVSHCVANGCSARAGQRIWDTVLNAQPDLVRNVWKKSGRPPTNQST